MIKALTKAGKRLTAKSGSGNAPGAWLGDFRLNGGKLEGSFYQIQRGQNEWVPIAFDGKKLQSNYVIYWCPPEIQNGCPYKVSEMSEIISIAPLQMKTRAVWSQQFGHRSVIEH